jgi:hypothetical protein
VREHVIFTPDGYIIHLEQIPGRRHDVQGLYALLRSSFQGHLLADNGYWPNPAQRQRLEEHHIRVTAASRRAWRTQHAPPIARRLAAAQRSVERRLSNFDQQCHAGRTLNRSPKHYYARRWTKALAHNTGRHLNLELGVNPDSWLHFQIAA